MEVAAWLRSLGLEQYAPAFHDNGVDFRVVPELTADDLKELGIGMVGHRVEAIAHLNKGLELVGALPPAAERDGRELDLRTLFGTAWMALRGWTAQEVWSSLHPALALANALRRSDAVADTLRAFHPCLCERTGSRVAALGHAARKRQSRGHAASGVSCTA
jgi:hypothetical protein